MNGKLLLLGIFAFPALSALILGGLLWFRLWVRESVFAKVAGIAHAVSTLSALGLIVYLFSQGQRTVSVNLGTWFSVAHYEFSWTLVADRLSLPFALFCALLVGLIGAFSRRYLHRESGYFRFYFLLSLFSAGVLLVVLAGSLDLVFVGWEIVGLTSALLIAFFVERESPSRHGLRAFITYRLCDVGLLAATVWTHHSTHSTEMASSEAALWGGFPVPASTFDALVVGFALLWASMGKSAQVPLGGWLPRAMEGPTPSSAIFYGAISVHLGPYLLLRAAPLLEAHRVLAIAVILVGALTALHGTFVGRAQTDIKSALAYASMTQVGLIFMEIGLGLRYLALLHIVGHAALRSLQILRSPSLLHDHHHLEQAVGGILPRTGIHLERVVPARLQPWLYRHALERGYFDAIVGDWILGSIIRFVRAVDELDRRFTSYVAGHPKDLPPHSLRGGR